MKKICTYLLGFLIAFFIIFAIWYLRNLFILNNLSKNAQSFSNINNYYFKGISYENDLTSINEIYYLDGKYIKTTKYFSYSRDYRSLTEYKDKDDSVLLIQSGEKTVARLNNVNNSAIPKVNNIFNNQNLFTLAFQNISTVRYNNKDCYLIYIKDHKTKYLVDKSSGLLAGAIKNDSIFNSNYTFNIVTQNDIQKPDIPSNAIID